MNSNGYETSVHNRPDTSDTRKVEWKNIMEKSVMMSYKNSCWKIQEKYENTRILNEYFVFSQNRRISMRDRGQFEYTESI